MLIVEVLQFRNSNLGFVVLDVVPAFTLGEFIGDYLTLKNCKHCGKEHENWMTDYCSFRCTADALDR